jgi:hypothetical protein
MPPGQQGHGAGSNRRHNGWRLRSARTGSHLESLGGITLCPNFRTGLGRPPLANGPTPGGAGLAICRRRTPHRRKIGDSTGLAQRDQTGFLPAEMFGFTVLFMGIPIGLPGAPQRFRQSFPRGVGRQKRTRDEKAQKKKRNWAPRRTIHHISFFLFFF